MFVDNHFGITDMLTSERETERGSSFVGSLIIDVGECFGKRKHRGRNGVQEVNLKYWCVVVKPGPC